MDVKKTSLNHYSSDSIFNGNDLMKTGLIAEGGGMKCAYGAAILDRMIDEGITFDYCIGVSAGSANLASYIAGQRDRNRRFYTEHLLEPDYFGIRPYLKTKDLFNLHYIYGTLSNSDGSDPLDFLKILGSDTEFEVVATDAATGMPHYFSKEEMGPDDYRIIMASCAIPAVCRPVNVNGRFYYDGGVSDSIPVRRALSKGCRKIVIISSKPRDFVKTPEKHRTIYTAKCIHHPNVIRALNRRHVQYTSSQHLMNELVRRGDAFLFAPSKSMSMSTYDMNPEENQALYDLGIADFDAQLNSLKSFLRVSRAAS